MKQCHEIIRELREDRDIKQATIASLLGTTQQQYSNYETGESELPLRALIILTDYYQVSADYLIGRKDGKYAVPGMDKKLTKNSTTGEVISDILALSAEGRTCVIDYIKLHLLNESCVCKVKEAPR